ncbi:MAG: DUF1611 domain-containing protein [Calditrichia bacterium]|nr:DUF1611 domain-containing protein [Calditrichia bacterium]
MKRRIVILAEKKFGPLTSKMANGTIRYLNEEVVAVIDSANAGKTVEAVLGFGGDIPVYGTLDEAFRHNPNTLLIGISPPGGRFPSAWYPLVINAIQNKLHIISGLHEYLSEIAEFTVLAEKYRVRIVDLRKHKKPDLLARGIARKFRSKIILTVGTHGNIGKMTTTIELVREMQDRGKSADWVATGQIGILIKGKGVPVDSIKGDFISGNVEAAIASADGNYEYVFVEGQGTLQHMGYSAAALGLLHGTLPDAMILCHRTDIGVSKFGVNTDDLSRMIRLHEEMVSFVKPSKVVGICLNTYNLPDDKSIAIINEIQKNTGLPATDPIKYGTGNIIDGLLKYFSTYKKRIPKSK